MSNEEEVAPESAPELDLTPEQRFKLEADGIQVDWFLQDLVRLVNTQPINFGITLHVEGLIICGQLIGAGEYLKSWTDTFLSVMDEGDLKTEMGQLFQHHIDEFAPHSNVPGPHMVHLRDAKIFAPGQQPIPTKGGAFWRGRLTAVSGFSFGTLASS